MSPRFTVGARIASALSVLLILTLALLPAPRLAQAFDPTASGPGAQPAPLPDPRFGSGTGLLRMPNGQWHLRQPVRHWLPSTVPGQMGAGLADACLAWVAAEPATFAGLDASSLRLVRQHPIPLHDHDPGVWWSVEFEQQVDGRPIEDAVLQFHIVDRVRHPYCRVALLLGRFFPTTATMAAPQIDSAACRDAAAAAAGVPLSGLRITSERDTSRIIFGEAIPFRHVEAADDCVDFVVNQVTGEVTIESTCHCLDTVTVQGSVGLDNHNPAQQVTGQPLSNVRVDHGGGVVYTDANGQAQVPDAATADIELVGLHCHIIQMSGSPRQLISVSGTDTADFADTSEFPKAENDVYFHTDKVWTYLSTRIDTAVNDSFFDTNALESQVNFNDSGNANFSSGGGQLGGPRCRYFRSDATFRNTGMADVVYHEYGHYVDWAMGGIFSAGGLSEGWGDVVAAFLTGDPQLGEGFRVADDPANGNGLRNADNGYQWDENDEIHRAGTAWSGFAWRVRQGLIDAEVAGTWVGPPSAIEYAERLIFAALDGNTTSIPDTITFVDIFDLTNGGTAVTQQIIDNAASAHGLAAYTAPEFQIESMSTNVGFAWQGQAGSVQIDVTVRNTDSVDHEITVSISGTDVPVADQTTPVLGLGNSHTLTFSWDASAAPAGFYSVQTLATVDGLAHQDTATVNVLIGPTGGSEVFFDDFESALGQWETITGDWGVQAANAFSGSNSVSESPDGDYSPTADTMMVTAPFSLEGVSNATVSLWHAHTIETDYDYGTIEMNSGGGPWTTLGWASGIDALHHETFDASQFDGHADVRLRLRFWTDPGTDLDGWNVDDVRVFGETTPGRGAPSTTAIASDGFESNDFAGGSGWSAGWTTSGNADVRSDGPATGTRHARLRGAGAAANRGSIERFADISGQENVHVQILLWTGGTLPNGYFPEDSFHVSLSDDGGSNWTQWVEFINAHNSTAHGYHRFEVAIADLGLSATASFGIRIRADDVNGGSRHTFVDDVAIFATNDPPVFDAISERTVIVDQALAFTVAATDPDGDAVTMSAASIPTGASFDAGTGAFAWTPGSAEVDQQFTATFEADDGINPASSMTVTINVVNAPPPEEKGGCAAGAGTTGHLQLWLLLAMTFVLVLVRRSV